jgi:hypothetical protein
MSPQVPSAIHHLGPPPFPPFKQCFVSFIMLNYLDLVLTALCWGSNTIFFHTDV